LDFVGYEMNEREAMKLALEALQDSEDQLAKPYSTDVRRAITAIKEALAQPEQGEPVAWRFKTGTFWNREPHWRYVLSLEGTEGLQDLEPLYTHSQPKRECPQAERAAWVGLTDEEKLVANQMWRVMDADGFIKAIEAKLKEKNA
jgi:hypothetical protein